MTRLLPLAAVLVLLAACGGNDMQTVSSPQPAQTPEPSASTPPLETAPTDTTTYSPSPQTPATQQEAARISVEELQQRLATGEVVLLDVRSRVSYANEHARGAVNIPLEEVGMRAGELPTDKWVVTYCT